MNKYLWVSLVLLRELDLLDNREQHHVVFVKAKTKEQAITAISKHIWSFIGWKKGKSKCCIIELDRLTKEGIKKRMVNGIKKSKVVNKASNNRTRKRVRKRTSF